MVNYTSILDITCGVKMPSPISIIHNGVVLLDQLTTANKFNNFFANLGQELASKIPIRAEYDPIKD